MATPGFLEGAVATAELHLQQARDNRKAGRVHHVDERRTLEALVRGLRFASNEIGRLSREVAELREELGRREVDGRG